MVGEGVIAGEVPVELEADIGEEMGGEGCGRGCLGWLTFTGSPTAKGVAVEVGRIGRVVEAEEEEGLAPSQCNSLTGTGNVVRMYS